MNNGDRTTALITGPCQPAVIGTCSCCGGRVSVPTFVVVGQTDVTPRCLDCGARKADSHGPVIQMIKPRD